MTRKHCISFIVSIHQPNVQVLNIFNKLYVLSKGGVNVYSGAPQSLKQYINNCHIDCNDNEIAIEKLLRFAANDFGHSTIIEMRAATLISHDDLNQKIAQGMLMNTNKKYNCLNKLSLSSVLYLAQRMALLYYHTLTLSFLYKFYWQFQMRYNVT